MDSSSQDFFERIYQDDPDPWRFQTSKYERDRFAAVIGTLGRRRYASAFEPGCSNGELTTLLAARCSRLEAMDIAANAVEVARTRCRDLPHVHIRQGDLRTDVPVGPFDLIVLSEIAYYFEPQRLEQLASVLAAHLEKGGELIAAHWLGYSVDHRLHGEEVHEILCDCLPLRHAFSSRHSGFRIDGWCNDAA